MLRYAQTAHENALDCLKKPTRPPKQGAFFLPVSGIETIPAYNNFDLMLVLLHLAPRHDVGAAGFFLPILSGSIVVYSRMSVNLIVSQKPDIFL